MATQENNSWPKVGDNYINRPTIGPKTNLKEANYCWTNIHVSRLPSPHQGLRNTFNAPTTTEEAFTKLVFR